MCVHAAHVACQPAWQPGGLPSASSSSRASKSEVPFLSFFLSLSPYPVPSPFFPLFLRKSSTTREEGYLPFYQTAAFYPEHSHPRLHLRLDERCNRWATTENARRDLKAVSRDRIFPRDTGENAGRTNEWPDKEYFQAILRFALLIKNTSSFTCASLIASHTCVYLKKMHKNLIIFIIISIQQIIATCL